MNAGSRGQDRVTDGLVAQHAGQEDAGSCGVFHVEVVRGGEVVQSFTSPNLIVNQGLDYKRDVALLDGTKIAAWYVIPIDDTPTIAAGDTYATHAGWAEVTAYDEATRRLWAGATGGTGVATNAADRAEFTISSGGADIGGVALVGGGSAATTKGDTAGGGTLFSVAAFTGGDRNLQESDVLRVTWQHTDSNAA